MAYTIIVVDDNADWRVLVTIRIRQHFGQECHILAAENGAEAWAIVERLSSCIVVSDIEMPCMDGLALLQRIRASRGDVKVILMSGGSQITEARAVELGAEGLCRKPFSASTLNDYLDLAVGH